MKVAIVVGHNEISQGGYSPILKKSEYDYNSKVAEYLSSFYYIYNRPNIKDYNTQINTLAEKVNKFDYDLVIELHFNLFDNKDNNKGVGTEAVVFPENKFTKAFGNHFCKEIEQKYKVYNRGVKEHGKGQRGYGFLSKINTNAIIVEPFFGDESEALKFKNEFEYAERLKNIIESFEYNS